MKYEQSNTINGLLSSSIETKSINQHNPLNSFNNNYKTSETITNKHFQRSNLPNIIVDNGMLELYHVRSFPKLSIDTEAGKFVIQTSGLALKSSITQKVLVFEYLPVNYTASFLPLIRTINNITMLYWDKRAEITFREELDLNYWQQSTFLALINAVVYENYIKWVESYILKHPTFISQSICSTADETSCFTSSQTWDTFLSDR